MKRRQGWIGISVLLIFSNLMGFAEANTHRNYADVKVYLREVEASSKGKATLFVLGDSDSGQIIEGLKIGNGPTKGLVVSTHHGNEYGSTEVALAFAQELAAQPMPEYTMYVIPVLNIQGYNARSRYEKVGGVSQDPNRDYPGPCGTDGPFHLKSTKNLADFIARESITVSATLHTYYPAVVYPWGISTQDLSTPYDAEFKRMVEAAARESHYDTGNSTAVIYPADGTFEDYAFWKHGIWSILFELGYSHSPSDADINEMIRVNVPGLRSMFEVSPKQLAQDHAFHGKCDRSLKSRDRRDE